MDGVFSSLLGINGVAVINWLFRFPQTVADVGVGVLSVKMSIRGKVVLVIVYVGNTYI